MDLSVLAIYAILALVVERIMELFSEIGRFRRNKEAIEDTNSRIKDLQTRIDELAKQKGREFSSVSEKQDERKQKQGELIGLQRNRALLFLVIGTIIAIVLSLIFNFGFNIGLLKLFGLEIPRGWDVTISALIIGSGTKPTHDLIGIIEKAVKTDSGA